MRPSLVHEAHFIVYSISPRTLCNMCEAYFIVYESQDLMQYMCAYFIVYEPRAFCVRLIVKGTRPSTYCSHVITT